MMIMLAQQIKRDIVQRRMIISPLAQQSHTGMGSQHTLTKPVGSGSNNWIIWAYRQTTVLSIVFRKCNKSAWKMKHRANKTLLLLCHDKRWPVPCQHGTPQLNTCQHSITKNTQKNNPQKNNSLLRCTGLTELVYVQTDTSISTER